LKGNNYTRDFKEKANKYLYTMGPFNFRLSLLLSILLS